MDFQKIPPVESADFYIDLAFRKAKVKANVVRSGLKGERLKKSRDIESEKINTIKDAVVPHLKNIISSFPSLEDLDEFYVELSKASFDLSAAKKALGAVNWALKQVIAFTKSYRDKIIRCKDLDQINNYRREYYGRFSSILKQINSSLELLASVRNKLKNFPNVDEQLFTVVIMGFPNVGKTTLLSKLTGSTADIQPYAFTTKSLNMGFVEHRHHKIQFIDCPGTLNRFDKMNDIEKIAYLAAKYLANMIVYVYDLTEPFPLIDQKKLLNRMMNFEKPIIAFLSKTDILKKDVISVFLKENLAETDVVALKNKIFSAFKEEYKL
ncbi:MAG: GTPase [Nanoarchaeota archaeon]|nr:50S ribosome-binding GTPase [Nanoarchaeota archaeon]MBU1029839.1 50S ribosome-binding GTPase [Nanoarchaeota archaeon]MBU1849524.1 50S ribosome-binding GTPase [Nanoarchaeota archaeon]